MAKDLSVQEGVNNADADFLNGKIVDTETIVGEGINQDIIQFFQKLISTAGLSANGNNDNEANGYQFIEALVKSVNGGLIRKVVEISNWNMQAASFLNVNHGIADFKKIRNVSAMILNDLNTVLTPIDSYKGTESSIQRGGIDNIFTSTVALNITVGGYFDSADYSGVGVRGYLLIDYVY